MINWRAVRTYLGTNPRTANAGANLGNNNQFLQLNNINVQVNVVEHRDTRLYQAAEAHHTSLGNGFARVPENWETRAVGVNVSANSINDNVPCVRSAGFVEAVVERWTRKEVLDDLARTIMVAQSDAIDDIGDLRIPRTLYTQIKLWATRKYVERKSQRQFVLRCMYRFETLNSLVSLFKILNPRPFGLTPEGRLCIIGEFGKMMKEIRRLHNEDTESAMIPRDIVDKYARVMGNDDKFHEWACIVGPSLVVVKSQTHKLADKIWQMAVDEAEESGAAW